MQCSDSFCTLLYFTVLSWDLITQRLIAIVPFSVCSVQYSVYLVCSVQFSVHLVYMVQYSVYLLYSKV